MTSSSAASLSPHAIRSFLNLYKKSKLPIKEKSTASSTSASLTIIVSMPSLSVNLNTSIIFLLSTKYQTPNLQLLLLKRVPNSNWRSSMTNFATSSYIKNSQDHSIISLCLQDPISHLPCPNSSSSTSILPLYTSKPHCMSCDTSSQPATTTLSTSIQ